MRDAIDLTKDLIRAQEKIDPILADHRRSHSENHILRQQLMAVEQEMEAMRGQYESTIQ